MSIPRPVEELRAMCRIITGACSEGTEDFISKLTLTKEQCSIDEAIEITKNAYLGDVFRRFFED